MKVVAILAVCVVAALSAPQHVDNTGAYQATTEYPIIPYEFAYEVADPETNNYHNRVEIKQPNGDVLGSWSVLLPDNTIQTVVYNVTGNYGFRYTITRTQAHPPQQQGQGQQQGQQQQHEQGQKQSLGQQAFGNSV